METSALALTSTPLRTEVSRAAICGYGTVSWGLFAADLLINMFYLQFLLDYGKISPTLAGFILSAGEGMELISSFIIGIASDKTRSPLGRRRPWILAGMFLLPGAIIACFSIPPIDQTGRVAFYFVAVIIYNFLFPVVSIPHQAMSPDMSQNYDVRMKLSTSRSSFSFVGMLTMVVYAFLIVKYFFPLSSTDEGQSLAPTDDSVPTTERLELPPEYAHLVLAAYPAAAVLIGGAFTVGLTELSIPTRPVDQQPKYFDEDDRILAVKRGGFCSRLCAIFRIGAFVLVVIMFSLCSTAIAITSSLLPLFIVNSIGFTLETFTLVTIVMTSTMVLTIIVLSRIARRFEKRTLFNFGCILSMLCYLGYFFIPGVDATDPLVLRYGVFLMSGFIGIGHALTFTVPGSMMADVTDLALVRLEEQHEGLMFSLMETVQSLLQASTMWILGLVLEDAGYVTDGSAQPEHRHYTYTLFAFEKGAYAIAWILSFFYPISRNRHKQILLEILDLRERKKGTATPILRQSSSRVLPVKSIIATTMVREQFNDAVTADVHAVMTDFYADSPVHTPHKRDVSSQESTTEETPTKRKRKRKHSRRTSAQDLIDSQAIGTSETEKPPPALTDSEV